MNLQFLLFRNRRRRKSSTHSTTTAGVSPPSAYLRLPWRDVVLLCIVLLCTTAARPSYGALVKVSDRNESRKASNCDIIIYSATARNGSIKSPSYPSPYPPNTVCRFEFRGSGRERIQISFVEFLMPTRGDYECVDSDSLQVTEPGRDGRFEVTDTLCGVEVPKPLMSVGNRMRIEFKGLLSGPGNRGFKADYAFLENYGINAGVQTFDEPCAFQFNSTQQLSGWVHTPNFPGAYPRNLECNFYFFGERGWRVVLRFTYFDVEGVFPCDQDTGSDYVEFSNFLTVDRKFGRKCGRLDKLLVRSDGRFFRVTFRSNDRLDGTGFTAAYHFELDPTTTELMPEVKQYSRIHKSALNQSGSPVSVSVWGWPWSLAALLVIYHSGAVVL